MQRRTLRGFGAHCIEFLRITWIPLLLLLIAAILLSALSILPKDETSRIILGVTFGVFVGLVVDVFKRSYDDFRKRIELEKISLDLLKADAIEVYKCFQAYENLLNKNKATIDPSQTLPPSPGLKNWKVLRQDMDFLLLSAREPLKGICAKVSTLEDLAEMISKARSGDKRAARLAIVMFQRTREKREHENLVSLLMTNEEIQCLRAELQSNSA